MGRAPGAPASEEGLNRGPWTEEEDAVLAAFMKVNGEGNWRMLPKRAGLQRCRKSCRLRWMNYLRPGLKRGNFTPDEDELIIKLHSLLGNRWSMIAGRIPGRTDNEIKNYWNTRIRRKLKSTDSGDMSYILESTPLSFDLQYAPIPEPAPSTQSYSPPPTSDHKHDLSTNEVAFPDYVDALAGSSFFLDVPRLHSSSEATPSELSSDSTCLEDSCNHYYSAWTPALDEGLSQASPVKREFHDTFPGSVLLTHENHNPKDTFSGVDFGYSFTGAEFSDSFSEIMNVHKLHLSPPVTQKNLVWPACYLGDGFW